MTMQADVLRLRDIHIPTAPPWWPPAPGWWMVILLVLLVAAIAMGVAARRRLRRRAIARLFDDAVARAGSAPERIAAMSELLRRASLRRDPAAATLQGDDWLRFLDHGVAMPSFADDSGRLLLEGGFRREVSEADVEALRPRARARFLEWMDARR
jgi:hypothetical protein